MAGKGLIANLDMSGPGGKMRNARKCARLQELPENPRIALFLCRTERNLAMYQKVLAGYTYPQLAIIYKCSWQNVQLITNRISKRISDYRAGVDGRN